MNLELNSVENIRDLGGYKGADGRKVKSGQLIRSAALDRLSEADAVFLLNNCNLRAVIDLRTDTEVSEKPDVCMDGVEHIHIPIFSEETIGISRGKKTEKSLLENDLPDMCAVYRQMVIQDSARERFAWVLRRIMAQPEGAVLWHCTAGKDRCGMTSVLLEYILGMDMDDSYADYMLTNEAAEPFANRIYAHVLSQSGNERRAEGVRRAFIADMDYLHAAFDEMEKRFGGIDGFIENGLGIDRDSIEVFRNRILE